MNNSSTELKTERSRLRRTHERGSYDRASLYDILAKQPFCHLGLVRDGAPVVVPTIQWREGDHIYWHASSASRAIRAADRQPVCLTVTIFDGMVMARSAFHHSVNFRSAMIFGDAFTVKDADEKIKKLETMVDTLFPGRNEGLRPINATEVKATAVQGMKIDEASVKIRAGGPVDDEEDYALPIWAGVLPLHIETGVPIADPRNLDGVEMPTSLLDFKIGSK